MRKGLKKQHLTTKACELCVVVDRSCEFHFEKQSLRLTNSLCALNRHPKPVILDIVARHKRALRNVKSTSQIFRYSSKQIVDKLQLILLVRNP